MAETTDWQVAKIMLRPDGSIKAPATSAQIAVLLELTPFQITARLAGMERRGLAGRDESGRWSLSERGAALGAGPEPVRAVRAARHDTGGAVGLPDDSKVERRQGCKGWKLNYFHHGHSRFCVFVDPGGTEWTHCHPMETAEFIIEYARWAPPIRMRKLAGSSLERLIQKDARQRKQWEKRANALAVLREL